MNARLLGLFSGFPTRHFPQEIAMTLKDELVVRDSLVFISAWPSDYERNDSDSAGMHEMFAEWAMPFRKYSVIDNRTDIDEAKQLLRDASCIFLMGGNATLQLQLILDKDISDEIRDSSAVIMGVSAGSSNTAKRALDIWESHVPYDGLGMVDITVKAHVSLAEQELLQSLIKISEEYNLPICAMEDESSIFIKNGRAAFTGQIRWINHGEVSPLSQEILDSVEIF